MNSLKVTNAVNVHSLSESVKKWRDQLAASSKSDGFNLLVESYGLEDVLCQLAKTDWNPEARIGELMTHIDYFYHKKRDGKPKKTVAAYYKCIAANGGTERVVAMLCNRWAEMKDSSGEYLYNVVLVTDVGPLPGEYELSKKVQRAYVPDAYATSIKDNFRDRCQAWAKIIKDFDIDIVVDSLWIEPVSYWDMLAIKGQPTKPAFIVQLHNFCLEPFLNAADTAISKIYKYMCCDGAVTLSECDKLFVSSFNNHVQCIVNPIAFNPRKIPLSTYNDRTIVWVGRLDRIIKQPVDAIKMMKVVVEKIPDAKLIIVGDGDKKLKVQMSELVQTNGLENNVEMVGFAYDVGRYYGRASVFICTSLCEGFSLTMGEAMAFGLPVLTYDMPWLSLIQDGRGIITVPQNNYETLAKKVIELLNNKEQMKKIGLCGKQHITEVSECNIEKQWRTFFDTIPGQTSHMHSEQDPVSVVIKYLTLFQHMGKHKAITNLMNRLKQSETTMAKRLEDLQKDLVKEREFNQNQLEEKLATSAQLEKVKKEAVQKVSELEIINEDIAKILKDTEYRLKKECENIQKQLENEKQKNIQLNNKNKEMQSNLQSIKKQKETVSRELNNVKSGWSFRTGRIITFVPRKIRDWLK